MEKSRKGEAGRGAHTAYGGSPSRRPHLGRHRAIYASAAKTHRHRPPDKLTRALHHMRDRQAAWARWLDGQHSAAGAGP